jgi:hypothetical protein
LLREAPPSNRSIPQVRVAPDTHYP